MHQNVLWISLAAYFELVLEHFHGQKFDGKNTRHYMLMNPDLYTDLTTRLKYATPPAVKNLVSTDQEIDAILRDASLPLREKCHILSNALNRLQLYKSMIDSESVAESLCRLREDLNNCNGVLIDW